MKLVCIMPRCMYAGGRNGVRRIKWCGRTWSRGWRGGARVGVVQPLTERTAATDELVMLFYDNYYWLGPVWPKALVLAANKLAGRVPHGEDSYTPFTTMIQSYFVS